MNPPNVQIINILRGGGFFDKKMQKKTLLLLFYKKNILKVYLFGMLADIIGALLIFFMFFVLQIGVSSDELYLTIPGVLLSSIMIFIFNYFITFKKLDKKNKLKLSLIFAIITAPYTFLIPISWIY